MADQSAAAPSSVGKSVVQIPESVLNYFGHHTWFQDKSRFIAHNPKWRIEPYDKHGSPDSNRLSTEERERSVTHDNMWAEIKMIWNLANCGNELEHKDREGFGASEIQEVNAKHGSWYQIREITRIFDQRNLFESNRIRKIYFLFNDSIFNPLTSSENNEDYKLERSFYELCVFEFIIKSVLATWKRRETRECGQHPTCQKLHVYVEDPHYKESDTNLIRGIAPPHLTIESNWKCSSTATPLTASPLVSRSRILAVNKTLWWCH
jgi:hypothetical protein